MKLLRPHCGPPRVELCPREPIGADARLNPLRGPPPGPLVAGLLRAQECPIGTPLAGFLVGQGFRAAFKTAAAYARSKVPMTLFYIRRKT
jgi:hypothetical protein